MLGSRGEFCIVDDFDGNVLRHALVIRSDGLTFNNLGFLVFRFIVSEHKHPILRHSLLAQNNPLPALNDEISERIRGAFAKFTGMLLGTFREQTVFGADHDGNFSGKHA